MSADGGDRMTFVSHCVWCGGPAMVEATTSVAAARTWTLCGKCIEGHRNNNPSLGHLMGYQFSNRLGNTLGGALTEALRHCDPKQIEVIANAKPIIKNGQGTIVMEVTCRLRGD